MAKPHLKIKASALPPPEPVKYTPPEDPVVLHFASIIAMWEDGDSFATIVRELKLPMRASELLKRINRDSVLREQLNASVDIRAHMAMDKALEWAHDASKTGDPSGYKVAIDAISKLAARLDPKQFGEVKKVELTGKDGGPIETKADMTLSPADAYQKLLGGAA